MDAKPWLDKLIMSYPFQVQKWQDWTVTRALQPDITVLCAFQHDLNMQ